MATTSARNASLVVLALVALGAATMYALMRPERAASIPNPAELPPERAANPSPSIRVPLVATDNSEAPAMSAGRRFLSTYWGSRWPEVENAMLAAGQDPDKLSPPTIPWEEAAVALEKKLRLQDQEKQEYANGLILHWRGHADAEWFRDRFGRQPTLTDEQRTEVERIVNERNQTIEPVATEFVERLDFEIANAWASGKYSKAPNTLVGSPDFAKPRSYFVSRGDGHEGWVASLGLTWEDCPGLREISDQARNLVLARDQAVAAYMRW